MTAPPDPPQIRCILMLLRRAYGRSRRVGRGAAAAVDVLVATILSQNTSAANSSAGYRALRRRLPSWTRVADAPVGAIERCIRVSGLGRLKAPRIRKILRRIRADRGRISLEFLRTRTPADACDYLLRFDGVGPKTALCVLLFAFGMRVFPVDTHVNRIMRRLGLLPEGTPPERAHEVLTPLIAPRDRYALHVLLIEHGRAACHAKNPRCTTCCLRKPCPSRHLASGRPVSCAS